MHQIVVLASFLKQTCQFQKPVRFSGLEIRRSEHSFQPNHKKLSTSCKSQIPTLSPVWDCVEHEGEGGGLEDKKKKTKKNIAQMDRRKI